MLHTWDAATPMVITKLGKIIQFLGITQHQYCLGCQPEHPQINSPRATNISPE